MIDQTQTYLTTWWDDYDLFVRNVYTMLCFV